jgi:hypothetical protein
MQLPVTADRRRACRSGLLVSLCCPERSSSKATDGSSPTAFTSDFAHGTLRLPQCTAAVVAAAACAAHTSVAILLHAVLIAMEGRGPLRGGESPSPSESVSYSGSESAALS